MSAVSGEVSVHALPPPRQYDLSKGKIRLAFNHFAADAVVRPNCKMEIPVRPK